MSSNEVLDGDGFYISYNSAPFQGSKLFGSDKGSSETALCGKYKFYILNGDYHKQYKELIPQGFEKCKGIL